MEAKSSSLIRIGTAGWSLPRAEQANFPGEGSHLERYSAIFPIAEINSTFHRPHRPATFRRWREAVQPTFRFSAKLPKTITHTLRLENAEAAVVTFLSELEPLGDGIPLLLVQLPPSLVFASNVADTFFAMLRRRAPRRIVCEPRHESWFADEADALLRGHEVARVAADPARVPFANEPGGWRGLSYYRLHGSPKICYSDEFLGDLALRLRHDADAGREIWCIFDNTTLGAATQNALALHHLMASGGRRGGGGNRTHE